MTTVTIGRAYFDALLRRAQFHTSGRQFELEPNLLSNVTISKAEYDQLQQSDRDLTLLQRALFRGGLTQDTLNTLLVGESEVVDNAMPQSGYNPEETFARPETVSVVMQPPHVPDSPPTTDDTETVSDCLELPQPRPVQCASHKRYTTFSANDSSEESQGYKTRPIRRGQLPVNDQRTVLITNLAAHTTLKDIVSIVRGGRLLDVFLRGDRSATVSFVEGAAEFLAYVRRNDIYLHAKRLDFRWADRQYQVLPHVTSKVAGGATRNLIVRDLTGKVTEGQIRDHLDHIHNLVVVDIISRAGDVHIHTNSVHHALTARTCMLSRTMYRGMRFDWALDECAAPLPSPGSKVHPPVVRLSSTSLSTANTYALLDTSSEVDSDSQSGPCMPNGHLNDRGGWINATWRK